MGYLVKMPKLSMQMESGVLLEWHVDEDDSVTEGDLIAEVESEKSIGEIEAREDGVLRRIYLEAGERTEPGSPIGIVAGIDEDISELEDAAEDAGVDAASESTAPPAETVPDEDTTRGSPSSVETSESAERITPAARRRARELDVTLEGTEGTGPRGAITSEDVERAAGTRAASSTVESATPASAAGSPRRNQASPRARRRASEAGIEVDRIDGSGPEGAVLAADVDRAAETGAAGPMIAEERELDGMRRTISDRLGRSYRSAVHVTHHRTVDAERLMDACSVADGALDVDVSLLDVLLIALSEALSEHPEFNATFEDDVHRVHATQDICVAVDVEAGLVAPVLTDVDSASLEDIARRRRDLTERTLAGEYTREDLVGGSFTVTNLGPFGIESFTPIINPPQVAILGVNALQEDPVRDGDGLEFRRQLPLSLSFDHRVVDGADAARFLETLAERIENAGELLVLRGREF